jgi:putative ABC transport system permease protein
MSAVLVKAIKDLRRRRLQVAVVFVTALLAVGTGTMALTLLSQTRDPYESAFAAQKGAHLQVAFAGRLDARTIAGTPALIGASASGGPYRSTDVQFQFGRHKYWVTTIGRDNPGGPVEQLRITAGHWPANDDEIALTRSFAELHHIAIGDRLKVVSVPQEPQLTVAAEVVDIDEGFAGVTAGTAGTGGRGVSGQHSWMVSRAIAALSLKDSPSYFMDYRFPSDPARPQLQEDLTTLRGALPTGSITSSTDYLVIRTVFDVTDQLVTAVLVAFSLFALLAMGAIVANLVTGIVIAAYREIGIMKALGFTPLQVEAVFVLQMMMPVAAASLVAIPLGTVASQPLLASSSQALGLAYQPTFSPALDVVALLGALAIAALAALLPAWRAGRLKPAAIITIASAPRGRSGRSLRRLAAGVRLPRPIVLGVGDAFARPLRAILTLVAVFVGVITLTVALGLSRGFIAIDNSQTSAGHVDVVVRRSPALADSVALRIISAERQTARVVGERSENAAVPGVADPVPARLFRGDASHLGFLLITGRWFHRAGEVVAPRALMHDAHLRVGDRFTVTFGSTPMSLALVGEVYDFTNLGYSLFLDWSTVSRVAPHAAPDTYLINVAPGSDVDAYVRRLAAAQPDLLDVQKSDTGVVGTGLNLDSVLLILAAVVIVIGVAGIFNTLLLNMRERVRDTATLKAIGMSPRQVLVMVAASAAPVALVGGVIAVPAGVGLNGILLGFISNIGGNDAPPALADVFAAWELLAIPLAGVAVAVAAALLPGRWAARTNVIEALHAE